jgi:hypothetical protein
MVYKAKMPEAWARMQWCRTAFGLPVKGGTWWRHRGHLYFREESHYTWYLLRWQN